MESSRIEKSIQIAAPVSRVWLALVDHRQFGEWFRVKVDGPFLPGQESTGHITWPGYEHLPWRAVIQKIQPETFFSFTWHPYAVDPAVDYSAEQPTLVEFTLQPSGHSTLLTVVESGFENVPAHRREVAFLRNSGGWAQQLDNVKAYAEAGA